MIIRLTVGLIKNTVISNWFFPEPYICSKTRIKVEVDLSNYATKSNLKQETGADTSKCAKKVDLTLKLALESIRY